MGARRRALMIYLDSAAVVKLVHADCVAHSESDSGFGIQHLEDLIADPAMPDSRSRADLLNDSCPCEPAQDVASSGLAAAEAFSHVLDREYRICEQQVYCQVRAASALKPCPVVISQIRQLFSSIQRVGSLPGGARWGSRPPPSAGRHVRERRCSCGLPGCRRAWPRRWPRHRRPLSLRPACLRCGSLIPLPALCRRDHQMRISRGTHSGMKAT